MDLDGKLRRKIFSSSLCDSEIIKNLKTKEFNDERGNKIAPKIIEKEFEISKTLVNKFTRMKNKLNSSNELSNKNLGHFLNNKEFKETRKKNKDEIELNEEEIKFSEEFNFYENPIQGEELDDLINNFKNLFVNEKRKLNENLNSSSKKVKFN